MAVSVLTNALIIVNGVTLSDHANHVTVTDTRDSVEVTGFGASNKAYTKGLGDATISINFFQDFAAGSVYATLQPLIGSSTAVTLEVRPTSGARSTTNVAFVMQSLLMNFTPIDGDVGAASMITADFVNGSNTGLQYLTA